MSQTAAIVGYAKEHANLTDKISRLDGVPSALSMRNQLVQNLAEDLAVREKRLKVLIKKRESEHKDFDTLQRSKLRQFFYKISHGGKEKLTKKLEKEEKEYIQAAQEEYSENMTIGQLKDKKRVTEEEKADLERQNAERNRLVGRLQELYRAVFTGPTPDFPEEDAAEEDLRDAERRYGELQNLNNMEAEVTALLNQALRQASFAVNEIQSAKRLATLDTFNVGGIWAQLAERDHLMQGNASAFQAFAFVKQAHELSAGVVPLLPPPESAQPEWLNVIFDNIFTDILYAQQITASLNATLGFQAAILYQKEQSEARSRSLSQPLREAKQFLESRRRTLDAIRNDILRNVAEGNEDEEDDRALAELVKETTLRARNEGGGGDGEGHELPSYQDARNAGPPPPPPPPPGLPTGARTSYAPPPGPPPGRTLSPPPPPPTSMPTPSPSLVSAHVASPPTSPGPGRSGFAPPPGPPPGRTSPSPSPAPQGPGSPKLKLIQGQTTGSLPSNNPYRGL